MNTQQNSTKFSAMVGEDKKMTLKKLYKKIVNSACRRRLADIVQILYKCFVFAGIVYTLAFYDKPQLTSSAFFLSISLSIINRFSYEIL